MARKNREPIVAPPGKKVIFRATKTSSDGHVLVARHYGLRGWPIIVDDVPAANDNALANNDNALSDKPEH